MPEIADYFAGFGIFKDLKMSGYQLTSFAGEHVNLARGEYEYPVTLTWKYISDKQIDSKFPLGLVEDLQKYVKGEWKESAKNIDKSGNKIIPSSYGNPYSCNFGIVQLAKEQSTNFPQEVIITAMGHSYRV